MPEAKEADSGAVAFEGVTPILSVRDLPTSVDYYTRVLGFRVDFHTPGLLASVSRGGCRLFLCEGDQGHPGSWVWIAVGDVELLFRDYTARGARVRHPPTNYQWAREMQIEDPDGHVLRFGSDPKEDEPVGEWLDMRGDAWAPSADGGWSRVRRG